MNIWLINHYAVPPVYYPLARTTNFAKYLMRMGHNVVIFAASSVHNSSINLITDDALYRQEIVDGIAYVYVRCSSYYNNGKQRIINMFEFPRRLKKICKYFDKPDAIVASSATPPACMAGLKIAKKYGARAVAEISDLWPESFVDYGLISRKNPFLRFMYGYEKQMYQEADELIFTAEGGYDYICERGWQKSIPREKVHYINNGVDREIFDFNQAHYQINDKDLKDEKIFKVVYTGSIRKVNNLGLLLNVAKEISDPKIKFLIWGDGDELPALQKRVIDERIDNVLFKGRVEKKYVPYITSCADLNIAHNNSVPLFRFGISFNKIFDYMAAGKPILSDFPCKYNPAVQVKAGIDISEPTATNIAKAIEYFVTLDTEEYQRFCANARKGADVFDFQNLTKKLVDVILSACKNK